MQIRPLYDRIVVKRIEQKETMQGGLYIPDSAKEKPQEGEVVAVGKGKRLEDGKLVPLDVAVVVPSPATSEVFDATSRTICAPMFSSGSFSSISLATVTPSLVMFGPPNFFSRTTFRPLGPRVTFTASASWLTPRRIACREFSA